MFRKALAGDGAKDRDIIVFVVRVLIAVVQATALYLLTDAAAKPPVWPATEPQIFVPLLLVSVYVPIFILLGLGQMRARPLAVWAALAAVLIIGLGYHDAVRGRAALDAAQEVFWPSYRLWIALWMSLFVAHVLVVDSVIERRLIPPYTRHFDTAWKLGLQAVLAVVFVGVFWGVLQLGAGLFKLVEIDFFRRLIEHRWFSIPATTLALAVSLHVTDIQPSLIRGTRSVALTLLSWLLPLLAVILLGFLGSLPFISLAPLWKTHFATALLLIAAGLLVFLINSCFQDGAAERTNSRIKRLAATVGAIELVPLVGLAAWALSLRVGQYGWTVQRITAAAVIGIAACYAIGYASAAVRAPSWLKRLEITNLVTAYVFLAFVLALFSPLADPARLMVASQVARLKSGVVRPEKFDFAALKFDGARWGAAALAELSQGKDSADAENVATRARQALSAANRYSANQPAGSPPTAEEMAERVAVYPAGRSLPAQFFETSFWPASAIPWCLKGKTVKCVARFITLHPGDAEAIVFLEPGIGYVFEQDPSGQWRKTGQVVGAINCGLVRQGIEHGEFRLDAHSLPDLVIGDQSLTISPLPRPCPPGSGK
jgi:hypothetical protein